MVEVIESSVLPPLFFSLLIVSPQKQPDEQIRFRYLKEKYAQFGEYSNGVWNTLAKWDENESHQVDIDLVVDAVFHIAKKYPMEESRKHADAVKPSFLFPLFLCGTRKLMCRFWCLCLGCMKS